MRRSISIFWGVLFLLGTGGCVDRPSQPSEGEWLRQVINEHPETLIENDRQLRGSGWFRMRELLTGIDSREHYIVELRFLQMDSRFILHSHFTGFHRRDGVEVLFQVGEDEDSLEVSVSTPGFPKRAIGTIEDIPLRSIVRLRVEIHDGTKNGIHVFCWVDQISFQGEVLRRLDIVAPGFLNAINTEADEEIFFSHGRGASWGAELEQVELRNFVRDAPYVL